MRYLLVILLLLTFVSCSSKPQVTMTPEMEVDIVEEPEEEDQIIKLCRGLFEHNGGTGYTVYCILRSLRDMKQVERMYMDRLITADQFRECLDPSYFPEYQTFWYPEVLRCLEEKINVEK